MQCTSRVQCTTKVHWPGGSLPSRVVPDLIAEGHGIPDTAQLNAGKHQAQRQRYWQGTASARDDGRVVRERIDGQDHYIDTVTGAVLWVDPSPPA
jgi:hypothetical protein